MPEKFEGNTPPQERKEEKSKNLGDFLPEVARSTGRPLEELEKTFGPLWRENEMGEELLNTLRSHEGEIREWVKQAEEGEYSTLEQGKSKLADIESVVVVAEAQQMAEALKKTGSDLYTDPNKLERTLNEFEKQIDGLEKANTRTPEDFKKYARSMFLMRNAIAYLLGKEMR